MLENMKTRVSDSVKQPEFVTDLLQVIKSVVAATGA